MTYYQQHKLLSFYRKFGILMIVLGTISAVLYSFPGVVSNSKGISPLTTLFVPISTLVIIVLSYKIKFIQKNIDSAMFSVIYVAVLIILYLQYLNAFSFEYTTITVLLIFLIGLVPLQKYWLRYIYLFTVIAGTWLGAFLHQELVWDLAPFLLSIGMSGVLTLILVHSQDVMFEDISYLSRFPEWNPNLIIEVTSDGKINYTNTKARDTFPDIHTFTPSHGLLSKAFIFENNTFSLNTENLTDKIKIKGQVYRREIVFNKETGKSSVIYLTNVHEDEKNAMELSVAKVKLEEQQKALINLLEDLSEEKEVKDTQSQNLLETIGEGVVLTNDHGVVTFVNRAFQELTGIKYGDIAGKEFGDVTKGFNLQGKELDKSELGDAAMVTAENQESKIEILRPDNKKVSVVVNASPINVRNEFRGVIRIIHDVSEEVKLQQQKDDFFSIASHELRTPLTVISGNLDIVLQGYGKSKLTKDDKDLLNDTIEASDRLIRMVNDFLNVSRLDQGRLKYELINIDANSIISSAVTQVQQLAQNKNIYLKLESPKAGLVVNADENLLREIVINLIGNAIKFTKEGGITVTETVNNGILEVRVHDTGAGIRKDMQKLLFQRFQQVMDKTLAREAGGTGLGLYISREFARVMKGDLKLEESDLGKGSTFLLTLPLVK